MALFSTTTRKNDAGLEKLKLDSKNREDYIAQIKRHVSQREDNLRNPVPLFKQLTRS